MLQRPFFKNLVVLRIRRSYFLQYWKQNKIPFNPLFITADHIFGRSFKKNPEMFVLGSNFTYCWLKLCKRFSKDFKAWIWFQMSWRLTWRLVINRYIYLFNNFCDMHSPIKGYWWHTNLWFIKYQIFTRYPHIFYIIIYKGELLKFQSFWKISMFKSKYIKLKREI